YAKREGGHVRTLRDSAGGTVKGSGLTSNGSAANTPAAVVPRRAGDIVVAGARAVVDFVVRDVHLGALRQNVVVAQGHHLRLPVAAASCATDDGDIACEGGIGAILAAAGLAIPSPDRTRSKVVLTVDDERRNIHLAGSGSGAVYHAVIAVAQLLVARADLAGSEVRL